MSKMIIFIGPPGSGKGTHCCILQDTFSLPHISMGDLVRAKLKHSSDSGLLIDDTVINGLFENAYKESDNSRAVIVDGYPRSIKQVEFLRELVQENNLIVFYFEVDYNVLAKRILGRVSCKDCGAVFNIYFRPTTKPGVCDHCGSKNIFKRNDDNEGTLSKRISEYEKFSLPVVEYYKTLGLVHKIDATLDVPEVSLQLINLTKKYLI